MADPSTPQEAAASAQQALAQALERALQLAINHHQSGNIEDAETLYRSILETYPQHAEANHNLGVLAVQVQQVDAALPYLEAAVQADPGQQRYWLSYIETLMLLGEIDAASKALALGRQYGLQGKAVDALAQRLPATEQTSEHSALEWTVVKAAPGAGTQGKNAETGRKASPPVKQVASKNTGGRLPPLKELQAVLNCYRERRYSEAEKLARSLTKRFPKHGYSWKSLALALVEQRRTQEALQPMQKAVELLPDDPEVHSGLGSILYVQGRYKDAEASYRRALQLKPDFVDAYRNLGAVLGGTGQLAEAETCLLRALELGPETASLHNNLGKIRQLHDHLPEAEASLRRALELKPDYIEAHNNIAIVFKAQARFLEAEAGLRRVLENKPDQPETLAGLGSVLMEQGRHAEAEASLRRALRLQSHLGEARLDLLRLMNHHPDRSAEEVYAIFRDYDELYGLPHKKAWQKHRNSRGVSRRLKVAYLSPDFHARSKEQFLEPLLAHHDKQALEVYLYAETERDDEVSRRYRTYADHWISTSGMSNDGIAERIRADGIDILVDLAGYTSNRLQVFARKPAPVSVAWLGHDYTTGLSAIDYFLTDPTMCPSGSEGVFAEVPWRMDTPSRVYRPADGMGLVSDSPVSKRGWITFGVLAHALCINDHTIRAWSKILQRVEGSRLFVDSIGFREELAQNRLAERFAAHGIGQERLEIGFHSPSWTAMGGIDIGLDCFPHYAGTTLYETLYMGIPYVTLAGRPGVGRLGSAILEGLGHPEWIARSEEEYIEKAVMLASDQPALAALRTRLRSEFEASPLMDEAGFARKVEQAYREMWVKWCEHVQDH